MAQELYDGFVTLEGGMDSGRAPELISPNQVSYAINTTFRDSFGKSRPPFRQPTLSFDTPTTMEWFKQYRIQGAKYYNLDGKTPVSIASVGGKIFEKRMNQRNAYIHDITPIFPDGAHDITGVDVSGQVNRNSMRQPHAWMQQADVYFIIQDGQSKAIIYDGAKARRAGPQEVPIGKCMAYGLGRIVVANGNQILIGDIIGGPTSILSFTETTFLNEGGALTMPADMGNIVGMTFTARQDTATGQGILLVFCERGVASVDLSQPRENWKSSAIQEIALLGVGASSEGSIVLVNDDVLFRSKDGIRSFRNAKSQFSSLPYSAGGNYGRTPISYEIKQLIDYDTPSLLEFASAALFDNRYLMTVSPKFNDQGSIFRGLGVMDFTPVTSTRAPAPACFDGLWTGISPVALTVGEYEEGDRCFAFCTDDNGINQVWEILKKGDFDNDTCPIESEIQSKALSFGDLWRYKNLQKGSLWLADLKGEVQFTISFRPDQYPLWVPWHTFTVGQPDKTCGNLPICSPVPMIPPQYRAGHKLPLVPEACDPNGGDRSMLKLGFSFQIRIQWRGHASISRLLLKAVNAPQLSQDCI